MGGCVTKTAPADKNQYILLMEESFDDAVSESSLMPCYACDTPGCDGLECAQCFMMIKSHAVPKTEDIVMWLSNHGVEVTKRLPIPDPQLPLMHTLYSEHIGKWYFKRLIDSVMDGVVALAVRSKSRVATKEFISSLRGMIGPSDMTKAVEGTLRFAFGDETPDNAVHCSDSVDAAQKELRLFFHSMKK